MFRVLSRRGRIGISDVVAEDHLSVEARAERGSYVGRIAGALSRQEYLDALSSADFTNPTVRFTHQTADGMHSATIQATKPERSARSTASRPLTSKCLWPAPARQAWRRDGPPTGRAELHDGRRWRPAGGSWPRYYDRLTLGRSGPSPRASSLNTLLFAAAFDHTHLQATYPRRTPKVNERHETYPQRLAT